jgi:hypothetical protein
MKFKIVKTAVLFSTISAYGQTELAFNPAKNANKKVDNLTSIHTSSADLAEPNKLYVRPFITDDARVVGEKLAQLETWLRFDREAGQHWVMAAYGPTKKLELAVGGVYGYQNNHEAKNTFSYALPLLQAKYLFKEYKPNSAPGFGVVVGTFLPVGQGGFKPAGYGSFGFITITQCFGEGDKFLLHGNVGGNYLHINNEDDLIATWGIGTQVKAYKGFHLVGEVFSGDPYVPGTGMAFQTGYRYFFSHLVQIDMTVGKGIAGDIKMPFWFSAGIRIVTERFLKKKHD